LLRSGRSSRIGICVRWIDWLETKLGRYAIPGLIRIVVAFNALVFVLAQFNPHFIGALDLDRERVFAGEVWRLVTYIFIPGTSSYFWIFFFLMFLWWVGNELEAAWGSFRLNLYYFLGMLGTTLAALAFGQNFSNAMLNSALFFALARFHPEVVIYLFFVLPVKLKWLAWIYAALLVAGVVLGTAEYRVAVAVTFANYLLFFGPEHWAEFRMRRRQGARRRSAAATEREEVEEPLHRCARCGRTEATDPHLDFRVASDGAEYCVDHLPGRP
jgi:hypothetical protein